MEPRFPVNLAACSQRKRGDWFSSFLRASAELFVQQCPVRSTAGSSRGSNWIWAKSQPVPLWKVKPGWSILTPALEWTAETSAQRVGNRSCQTLHRRKSPSPCLWCCRMKTPELLTGVYWSPGWWGQRHQRQPVWLLPWGVLALQTGL